MDQGGAEADTGKEHVHPREMAEHELWDMSRGGGPGLGSQGPKDTS